MIKVEVIGDDTPVYTSDIPPLSVPIHWLSVDAYMLLQRNTLRIRCLGNTALYVSQYKIDGALLLSDMPLLKSNWQLMASWEPAAKAVA